MLLETGFGLVFPPYVSTWKMNSQNKNFKKILGVDFVMCNYNHNLKFSSLHNGQDSDDNFCFLTAVTVLNKP